MQFTLKHAYHPRFLSLSARELAHIHIHAPLSTSMLLCKVIQRLMQNYITTISFGCLAARSERVVAANDACFSFDFFYLSVAARYPELIGCGTTTVRLVSSGSFDNSVTVAIRQLTEDDSEYMSVFCPPEEIK